MHGLLVALLLHLGSVQQVASSISGVVIDLEGKVVPEASVRLTVAGRPVAEARTGPDGRFEMGSDATGEIVMTAYAPGFASTSMTVQSQESGPVRLMLRPIAFFEFVQVTSSRGNVAQEDPNLTMTVFPMPPLRTRPALTVDDTLRIVPGFTLNRRTSSRVSNPGSQSMTLRVLGGAW